MPANIKRIMLSFDFMNKFDKHALSNDKLMHVFYNFTQQSSLFTSTSSLLYTFDKGGVYKARMKGSYCGKSGGYRIIYYKDSSGYIHLLDFYSKKWQVNLFGWQERRLFQQVQLISHNQSPAVPSDKYFESRYNMLCYADQFTSVDFVFDRGR